jgi:hypothetical protein
MLAKLVRCAPWAGFEAAARLVALVRVRGPYKPPEERSYGWQPWCCATLDRVHLLTNNPAKVEALARERISISRAHKPASRSLFRWRFTLFARENSLFGSAGNWN